MLLVQPASIVAAHWELLTSCCSDLTLTLMGNTSGSKFELSCILRQVPLLSMARHRPWSSPMVIRITAPESIR